MTGISRGARPRHLPLNEPTRVGSGVRFTLTLTNRGQDPASAARLSDKLPRGLAFVSSRTSVGHVTAAQSSMATNEC